MDKKQLVGIAIVLALAGCAAPRGEPRFLEPTDGDLRLLTHPAKCEVGVYVDDEQYILIDHEPVHARGCPTAPGITAIITWKVDGAYKFASNGIELKTPTTSPPDPKCYRSSSGKQFRCEFSAPSSDPLGAGHQFKYTIRLTRNNGAAFGSLDPMMINY